MIFLKCPKAWARDEGYDAMNTIIDIAAHNATGVLPDSGGRLDQCPLWIEALGVVNSYLSSIEKSRQATHG